MRCHRSSDGTMKICRAETRGCPFGGEEIHHEFADRTSVAVWNEADRLEHDSHYLMASIKGDAEHGVPVTQARLEHLIERNEEMRQAFQRDAEFVDSQKYRSFELRNGGPKEITHALYGRGEPNIVDYSTAVSRLATLPPSEEKTELGRRLLQDSYALDDFDDGYQWYEHQRLVAHMPVGDSQKENLKQWYDDSTRFYHQIRPRIINGLRDCMSEEDLDRIQNELDKNISYQRVMSRQRLAAARSALASAVSATPPSPSRPVVSSVPPAPSETATIITPPPVPPAPSRSGRKTQGLRRSSPTSGASRSVPSAPPAPKTDVPPVPPAPASQTPSSVPPAPSTGNGTPPDLYESITHEKTPRVPVPTPSRPNPSVGGIPHAPSRAERERALLDHQRMMANDNDRRRRVENDYQNAKRSFEYWDGALEQRRSEFNEQYERVFGRAPEGDHALDRMGGADRMARFRHPIAYRRLLKAEGDMDHLRNSRAMYEERMAACSTELERLGRKAKESMDALYRLTRPTRS